MMLRQTTVQPVLVVPILTPYPFELVVRCREFHNIFSNSSDPDQRAPIGALWSGSRLLENVNRISGISLQDL